MSQNHLDSDVLDVVDAPIKELKVPAEQANSQTTPKEPELYLVFAQNDKTTPVEFVEKTLTDYFNLSAEKAKKVIELAEKNGKAFVASYPKDVAESKVETVNNFCRTTRNPVTGGNMELQFTCVPSY